MGGRGRAEAASAGDLAGAAAGGRVEALVMEAGGEAAKASEAVGARRRSQNTAPDSGPARESSRLA